MTLLLLETGTSRCSLVIMNDPKSGSYWEYSICSHTCVRYQKNLDGGWCHYGHGRIYLPWSRESNDHEEERSHVWNEFHIRYCLFHVQKICKNFSFTYWQSKIKKVQRCVKIIHTEREGHLPLGILSSHFANQIHQPWWISTKGTSCSIVTSL